MENAFFGANHSKEDGRLNYRTGFMVGKRNVFSQCKTDSLYMSRPIFPLGWREEEGGDRARDGRYDPGRGQVYQQWWPLNPNPLLEPDPMVQAGV